MKIFLENISIWPRDFLESFEDFLRKFRREMFEIFVLSRTIMIIKRVQNDLYYIIDFSYVNAENT